jgi:hypothetical protein
MTTTVTDTILARIQKLLVLTDRAGTPAEAANAAARAQELLFKHNLTLAQVEAHDGHPAATYANETLTLDGGKFHIQWHRSLAGVLARNNFCRIVVYSGSSSIALVGLPDNIAVVTHLYGYLARELRQLALAAMRLHCPDPRPAIQGQFVRTFCLGAVAEINRRLQAQRAKDTQASAASTALVVQSDAALKTAVARYFPKLEKGSAGAPARGNAAYGLGVQAGRTINLSRGALGASNTRALGGR